MLVGEMGDLETISLALTAAETGHLVFATLHTRGAPTTITRIIDVFPSAAGTGPLDACRLVQAVITQALFRRSDGKGQGARHLKSMTGTPAVRNLIRENKIAQLASTMQTSKFAGMQTMEVSVKP